MQWLKYLRNQKGRYLLARNDGVNRTIVRNASYRKSGIAIRERHNERHNEHYYNSDVMLEHKDKNIHFKQCYTSYMQEFEKLVDEKIISTRGLQEDAKIIDELVFDVNSKYFEDNGWL